GFPDTLPYRDRQGTHTVAGRFRTATVREREPTPSPVTTRQKIEPRRRGDRRGSRIPGGIAVWGGRAGARSVLVVAHRLEGIVAVQLDLGVEAVVVDDLLQREAEPRTPAEDLPLELGEALEGLGQGHHSSNKGCAARAA